MFSHGVSEGKAIGRDDSLKEEGPVHGVLVRWEGGRKAAEEVREARIQLWNLPEEAPGIFTQQKRSSLVRSGLALEEIHIMLPAVLALQSLHRFHYQSFSPTNRRSV